CAPSVRARVPARRLLPAIRMRAGCTATSGALSSVRLISTRAPYPRDRANSLQISSPYPPPILQQRPACPTFACPSDSRGVELGPHSPYPTRHLLQIEPALELWRPRPDPVRGESHILRGALISPVRSGALRHRGRGEAAGPVATRRPASGQSGNDLSRQEPRGDGDLKPGSPPGAARGSTRGTPMPAGPSR